jgi:hypothetical protein
LTLTNFLEKYEDRHFLSDHNQATPAFKDKEECFEHTVNGLIIYDCNHPYYSDEKFFSRLLQFYQQLENYEKCSELVNTKKQQ